jgi:hypothetical protein
MQRRNKVNNRQTDVDDATKRVRRFIAVLGVLLVLAGQFLDFSAPIRANAVFPPYIWLSILGVLLFISSMILRPAPVVQALFNRLPHVRTFSWVLAAGVFSVFATLAMVRFQQYARVNYIPILTLWGLSMVCYIAAFAGGLPARVRWMGWLKEHRSEILAVGLITIAGAILRFYLLGAIPRIINGDEGALGLAAQSTTGSDLSNPFALWDNFSGLYLQTTNLVFQLLGVTPFALRLLPAIGGTLAIPASYLFARQVAGHRTALIAAILLAFSHAHINFSRIAPVAYIHDTWLVPFELYFLLSGIEKRSSWRAALGGMLLALHFSVYLTAQVISALILVYMVIGFLFLHAWLKPAIRQLAVFWGGFLIVVLPEAVFIWGHPNEFFSRLNAEGTFQSGWLAQTMAQTGQSAFQIVAGRVVHAFLSLIYYPAIDFYGSPIPMLTFITAALFLLGLGIALWRTRSPEYLLLNGYFWAPALAVGIFATPPSADSYRMLTVFPAAFLMAAIALDQMLDLFGLGWNHSRMAYGIAAGIVLLSLLGFNLWTYFGDFAGQCRFGGTRSDRFASYLGSYVRTIDNESRVYLLSNDDYFYGSHPSVDFLSQHTPIINFPEPVQALDAASGETVIANPDRIDELETWIHNHPGGQINYLHDCTTRILLGYHLP